MVRGRVALVVGLLLAAVVAPWVVSGYALTVLALVALYATAALAQNLLSGYADVPSLGNVAFFAAGAYVAGSLVVMADAPAAVAFAGGIGAAGVLGLLVGLPSLRISGMHLAIVSVAVVLAGQEVMGNWDAAHDAVSSGVPATAPGWLLGDRALYGASVVVATVAYLAVWNLLRSRSGRGLLALNASPEAATAAGVPVVAYRLMVFVSSGLLTGMAGVVYLYYAHQVTPATFSLDLSLAFLTMMILGGTRSLGGSLVGAALIGLLPEVLRSLPATLGGQPLTSWAAGLWAMLLLLCLWFFPEGLWNGLSALARVRPGPETEETSVL